MPIRIPTSAGCGELRETELGFKLKFSGASRSCTNSDEVGSNPEWEPQWGSPVRSVFVEDVFDAPDNKRYGEYVGHVRHEQGAWIFQNESSLEGVASTRLEQVVRKTRTSIEEVIRAIDEAAKDLPLPGAA